MKLNVDIKDDAQLRKEVKQIIQNAVDGTVVDEIKNMIMSALGQETLTSEKIFKLAENNVSKQVQTWMHNGWNNNGFGATYTNVAQLAREEIKKALASEKMQTYILEQIEKQVGTVIKDVLNDVVEKSLKKAVEKDVPQLVKKELKKLVS